MNRGITSFCLAIYFLRRMLLQAPHNSSMKRLASLNLPLVKNFSPIKLPKHHKTMNIYKTVFMILLVTFTAQRTCNTRECYLAETYITWALYSPAYKSIGF